MTPKFTTRCLIRRNTKSLRKKLKDLGYNWWCCQLGDPILVAMTFNFKDQSNVTSDELTPIYISTDTEVDNYIEAGCIDCGENEQLFLALAALRDDSDKFQWFCDDELGEYKSLFFCKYDDVEQHIHNEMDGWDCEGFHKATPEDLIEHFKEK